MARVWIASAADTVPVRVEIARTEREQREGLRGRAHLPDGEGMLFLFEEEHPPTTEFWMYRTRVPLSVALLDAGGTIRAIRDLEPCASRLSLRCPTYEAGVAFHAALEVPRGYFGRVDVGVGDRVILPPEPITPASPPPPTRTPPGARTWPSPRG